MASDLRFLPVQSAALRRMLHIHRWLRRSQLRSCVPLFAEQFAQVREHVIVKADFAGIGGGDDDQHFKQQHLRVRAYRSAEEERRVHYQAHQGGEGGEGAEDQPQADQELAVRNKDVEEWPTSLGQRDDRPCCSRSRR